MDGFEPLLRKSWRTRVRALGLSIRLPWYWLGDAWRAFVAVGFTRLLAWGVMLSPFPQGWHFCAVFATTAALWSAARLAQRGQQESLLALYGADDRALLEPTRRWQRRRFGLAVLDVLVTLGVWWLQGRIPAWVVFLGVPAYATAAVLSPRVLLAVLPPRLLSYLAGGSVIVAMLAAMLIGPYRQPAEWSEPLFWMFGLGSPSGWAVLMLHGLLDQNPLHWGFLPLFAASAWVASSLARVQDRQLFSRITAAPLSSEEELRAFRPWEDENGDEAQVSGGNRSAVTAALNDARERELLDLPVAVRAPSRSWRKAGWTAGILLGLAILSRPEFWELGHYRLLAFGVAVAVSHCLWFPLLGLPEWLWNAQISQQREVSMCVLFPAPLRTILWLQIGRDLRQAWRVGPGLAVLVFLSFQIAFAPPPLVTLGSAVLLMVIAGLLLPLRWLRMTLWVLAGRPFRLARIAHGALVMVIVGVLLFEAVYLTISAYLVFGEMDLSGDRYWVAALVLIPAVFNALLALAGTGLALRAFEKARYDAVKLPPRS